MSSGTTGLPSDPSDRVPRQRAPPCPPPRPLPAHWRTQHLAPLQQGPRGCGTRLRVRGRLDVSSTHPPFQALTPGSGQDGRSSVCSRALLPLLPTSLPSAGSAAHTLGPTSRASSALDTKSSPQTKPSGGSGRKGSWRKTPHLTEPGPRWPRPHKHRPWMQVGQGP